MLSSGRSLLLLIPVMIRDSDSYVRIDRTGRARRCVSAGTCECAAFINSAEAQIKETEQER